MFETFGSMGKEYSDFLTLVTEAAVDSQLINPELHFKSSYKTRLVREASICLQRGNAIAVYRGLLNTRARAV